MATTGAVMTAPSPTHLDKELTVVRPERPWVTIVWNDPVNLMSYVTWVFQKLLGHPRPEAERLMMQVHEEGRATVAIGTKDAMEADVAKLQGAGLWATLAQD